MRLLRRKVKRKKSRNFRASFRTKAAAAAAEEEEEEITKHMCEKERRM